MTKRVSAGILPYRTRDGALEVLIVHPGGPVWARRDEGAWSLAKGELEPEELPEVAARRELLEETGWTIDGPLLPLGSVVLKSGKTVHGFAGPLDVDPSTLRSGTFRMEWPRGSGQWRAFPEVDRAAWFSPEEAKRRLNVGQAPLVDRLTDELGGPVP